MPAGMLRSLALSCALFTIAFAAPAEAAPCSGPAAVCPGPIAGGLPLIAGGRPLPIVADGRLDPGVLRAARNVQADLGKLAGQAAAFATQPPLGANAVV